MTQENPSGPFHSGTEFQAARRAAVNGSINSALTIPLLCASLLAGCSNGPALPQNPDFCEWMSKKIDNSERIIAALEFIAERGDLYPREKFNNNDYIKFINRPENHDLSSRAIAGSYLSSKPNCCEVVSPSWKQPGFFTSGYKWDDVQLAALKEIEGGQWAVDILVKNSPDNPSRLNSAIHLKGGSCNTISALNKG